jgi:hypothetical protein
MPTRVALQGHFKIQEPGVHIHIYTKENQHRDA